MKCELCHIRPPESVVWKEIDGEMRELYVCKECAENERGKKKVPSRGNAPEGICMNLDLSGLTPAQIHDKVMESITKLNLPKAIQQAILDRLPIPEWMKVPDLIKENDVQCPSCKRMFSEAISTWRFGCAYCYEAFREKMEKYSALKRNTRYLGKVPGREPPGDFELL